MHLGPLWTNPPWFQIKSNWSCRSMASCGVPLPSPPRQRPRRSKMQHATMKPVCGFSMVGQPSASLWYPGNWSMWLAESLSCTTPHPGPASGWRRAAVITVLLLALATMLAGCGFRMRGASPLAFDSIYTNIAENSPFGAQLRRAIRASSPHTHFVDDPNEADVHLVQEANRQIRRELSIDAEGHVEE